MEMLVVIVCQGVVKEKDHTYIMPHTKVKPKPKLIALTLRILVIAMDSVDQW